eukprot:7309613-Ditylum_brightwellii.AAC.2
MIVNCKQHYKVKIELGHDWGKALLFCPVMGVEVTKDAYAVFGQLRKAMLIVFDDGDCYGRECRTHHWSNMMVFFFREVFPGLGV